VRKGTPDRMSSGPTSSSPKRARMGPWCWFGARTTRRGRWFAQAAAARAEGSWDGSLTEFLAALDPGTAHDWARAAVGKPSGTTPGR
jgi:hypothetical protein